MSQNKIRYYCDPQAYPGQVQKKVVAGQLCLRGERKAVTDKKLMKEFAGSAGFFQHKNGILCQLRQGKLFPFQGKIILSCYKDILKFSNLIPGFPAGKMGIGGIDHNKIYLIVLEEGDTVSRGSIGNLYTDIGVFPVEPLKVGDQEIAADGVAGANPQGSLH